MKTTCKTKTVTVELYADEAGKIQVGKLEIPDYENMPRLIVIDDTIYMNDTRYRSLMHQYHAIGLVHVAQRLDLIVEEPKPAPVPASQNAIEQAESGQQLPRILDF